MRKESYKDISWDADDLLSSKHAVNCMLINGISEEEILSQDFGNLDVAAVIEEYYQ